MLFTFLLTALHSSALVFAAPVNTCLYETIRAVDVISFQAVTAVSTVFTAFKVLENFRLD